VFLPIDTLLDAVLQSHKDKPFGGKSLTAMESASEAADLPGRAGLQGRRGNCPVTPHPTPGGENPAVFTSFLFLVQVSKQFPFEVPGESRAAPIFLFLTVTQLLTTGYSETAWLRSFFGPCLQISLG
jgi:hypothetical protein